MTYRQRQQAIVIDYNNGATIEELSEKYGFTAKNIQALVDLLPEEQREIIVLRHYANLSFKEIAQMTNCSINTALGRMRYGLINLRKMMNERGMSF